MEMISVKKCPKCNCDTFVKVCDSRPTEDGLIYRKRKCEKCNYSWGTIEIALHDYMELSTKDSTKDEQFIIDTLGKVIKDLTLTKGVFERRLTKHE